ncbi:hypothetical protein SK128_001835 [Halocaridina rubra]|uniref:Uncharacterized protein n=1 Tax=Halocaridina rubra TaxID=373956 RepID=A0AAN8X7C9_HALRR
MTSYLKDLLDWVWQIIATWLTVVIKAASLPICTEEPTTIVISTADPEMAFDKEAFQEEALNSSQNSNASTEIKKMSTSFSVANASDITVSSVQINHDDVGRREDNIPPIEAYDIKIISPGSCLEETNIKKHESESHVTETDDEIVIEDLFSSHSAIEELLSTYSYSTDEEEKRENGNIERDVLQVEVEGSTTSDIDDDANHSKTRNSNVDTTCQSDENRRNVINEDDDDHDSDVDWQESYSDDKNFILLLKLISNVNFREVLTPQYYCLNFKTSTPLPTEKIYTALKQLRRLLPWIGIGLRKQRKDSWVCLYPEDHIDYQVVDDEESVWNIINNTQSQFCYTDNSCLSTFRLMEARPCSQCRTLAVDSQESSAVTRLKSGSGVPLLTKPTSSACKRDEIILNVTDSRVIGRLSHSHPETSNGDFDTSSSTGTLSSEKSSLLDGQSDIVVPSTSNMPPDSINENEKRTFYHLIYSIPLPLANEATAQLVCDNFIKELNCEIQRSNNEKTLNVEKGAECDTDITSNENDTDKSVSDESSDHCDNYVSVQSCDTALVLNNTSCNDIRDECVSKLISNNSHIQKSVNITDTLKDQGSRDIKGIIKNQLSAIENAFTAFEDCPDINQRKIFNNNNPNAIDRNSPYIERVLETFYTKNFVNRCKQEQVTYVSAFVMCMNVAAANFLVKRRNYDEYQGMKIGYNISVHQNFEDLTDYEWQDRDNDQESTEEEVRKPSCCVPETVCLVTKSGDAYSKFWERVQLVNQRYGVMCSVSTPCSQKIPNGRDVEETEENFSSICHPSATLGIINIKSDISRFSRQGEHLEVLSLQKFSSLSNFFIANTISLNLSGNHLKFSLSNQGQFVSHRTAHYFADEILTVLKNALTT